VRANAFTALDDRFFSLGQDVSFYSNVAGLGRDAAAELLASLKDVVADDALFARAANDTKSMGTSSPSGESRLAASRLRMAIVHPAIP
jgi:hypothetical protein